MKQSILALSVAAAATFTSISAAQACTTWVADTTHGISVARSVDWSTQLGSVAQVYPQGSAYQGDKVRGYAQAVAWRNEYNVMALREFESFHGAAVTAINLDTGMSVNGQYMEDSLPFLSAHKDSGVPAVSLGQLATYIASNFADVAEVKQALETNKFQIAWSAGLAGAQHGVHFSAQDRMGNKLLIQLNEGGEQQLHFNDADLRVMVNAPLQQGHRDYISRLDMDSPSTLTEMSAHISSKERNARLLYMSHNADLRAPGISWARTEGKMWGLFDRAVLVPQDLVDPDNGDTYATWVSYLYNFDNGSFKFRNHDTGSDIRIDLNHVAAFSEPLCADLVAQANAGQAEVSWGSCAAFE